MSLVPHFDTAAATWDLDPARLQTGTEIAAAIAQALPLSSDMDLLDVGCGTGRLAFLLYDQVNTVTGTDGSQGMLDAFKQKISDTNCPNASCFLSNTDAGMLFQGDYDVVVSSMALHHFIDSDTMIKESVRVLRPSGWLAIADLEEEDGTFHSDPDAAGVNHFGFSRQKLTDLFESHGLSNIQLTVATTINKEIASGETRAFPVLLAVGQKKERPA